MVGGRLPAPGNSALFRRPAPQGYGSSRSSLRVSHVTLFLTKCVRNFVNLLPLRAFFLVPILAITIVILVACLSPGTEDADDWTAPARRPPGRPAAWCPARARRGRHAELSATSRASPGRHSRGPRS